MKKQKDGFIYIWRDSKHKRYYIGSHWGSENDSYICSSTNMKHAYKRRPKDFKRKIVQRLQNCLYTELLEIEYKWLKLAEKRKERYYNLNFSANHWASRDNSKSIGQKISESHKSNPNWGQWSKGKILSDETKEKLRQANKKQFQDLKQIELRKNKSKELWNDPEYRSKCIASHTGRKESDETRNRKRISMMGKNVGKSYGPLSKERKDNLSNVFKNMIWINDGIKNKRINIKQDIPFGYIRGRKSYI